MKGWTLDDIPWHRFDAARVDADLVRAMKAAALVEHNGYDYETYLHRVFAGDPAFCADATAWAREEVRHGQALARWAAMADPSFDFDACFARFTAGYRLPLDIDRSVRGSLSGEMIARCVVEAATSSFYSAIGDAAEEPVLKTVCGLIAADEFRHYRLFYDTLKRYLEAEGIGPWRRVRVAAMRVVETRDDELPYAYHCGNALPEPYDRRHCARAYSERAYGAYRRSHYDRGLGMILKAAGLKPRGWLARQVGRAGWRLLRRQAGQRAAAPA